MWGLLRQVRWVSLLKISYISSMHFKNLLFFYWLGCCFQQNHEEPSRPPSKRHWSKVWVQVRDECRFLSSHWDPILNGSGNPSDNSRLIFLFIWNRKIKLCKCYVRAAVVLIFISFSFVFLCLRFTLQGAEVQMYLEWGWKFFYAIFHFSSEYVQTLVLDILHRSRDVC